MATKSRPKSPESVKTPPTVDDDKKITESSSATQQITDATHAKVIAICEIADGGIYKLIQLYLDADYSLSGDVKNVLAGELKQQLALLASSIDDKFRFTKHESGNFGCGYIDSGVLRALINLEQDPINSDQCVTNVFDTACKHLEVTMHLWKHFTHGNGTPHPLSDRFLRKHLEIYEGDLQRLSAFYDRLRSEVGWGRRSSFVSDYIKELRKTQQLPLLQAAKGNYDTLMQYKKSTTDDDFQSVRDDFITAINETLPTMIAECEGDLDKLFELFSTKSYCDHPQVGEAIKQSLSSAVEQCGGDFGKLAELLDKTPQNFRGIIRGAVTVLCESDKKKVVELVGSSLAELAPELVTLNLDIVEQEGTVDIDLFKNLLGLKNNLGEHNAHLSSVLDKGIKRLVAKFIEAHTADFDQLVALNKALEGTDDKKGDQYPEIDEAIKGTLLFEISQCDGDLVKLGEIFRKTPKVLQDIEVEKMPDGRFNLSRSDDIASAAIAAIASCSSDSIIVMAENDLSRLETLRDKIPCQLHEAIQPLIIDAAQKIAGAKATECAGNFVELENLYDKAPYFIRDAVNEIVTTFVAQEVLPNLIAQCNGDLKQLGDLYDQIPWRHREELGKTIVDSAKLIAKSSIQQCADNLDALVNLYNNIPYCLRNEVIKDDKELEVYISKLLVPAIEECDSDIDALKKLKNKMLPAFDKAFGQTIEIALPSIIVKCAGDFGKLAQLYDIVPPECRKIMQSSIKTA